ncbi:hypothetical protein EVAR_34007_1 [Eumeta japonica]|uniref:Uncharacterized protein n=1 Tax=Eumeta variegata TaxID=151549 RepID=A0A4C1VUS4_EUMVA|nr:hypothetical protein EVAR_34007_1 [Eumeta japonica]
MKPADRVSRPPANGLAINLRRTGAKGRRSRHGIEITCCCARGRPIIVEWERRKAFGGPLSFGNPVLRQAGDMCPQPDADPDQNNSVSAVCRSCFIDETKLSERESFIIAELH